MRRSQTLNSRHSARPSIFTAEDLGALKEIDESTEDMLRRQLLEQERENDKVEAYSVRDETVSHLPRFDSYGTRCSSSKPS